MIASVFQSVSVVCFETSYMIMKCLFCCLYFLHWIWNKLHWIWNKRIFHCVI